MKQSGLHTRAPACAAPTSPPRTRVQVGQRFSDLQPPPHGIVQRVSAWQGCQARRASAAAPAAAGALASALPLHARIVRPPPLPLRSAATAAERASSQLLGGVNHLLQDELLQRALVSKLCVWKGVDVYFASPRPGPTPLVPPPSPPAPAPPSPPPSHRLHQEHGAPLGLARRRVAAPHTDVPHNVPAG